MHTVRSSTRSTRRRARLLSVATVALIVAACGGAADPTASTRSAGPDPSVAVAPAPVATPRPTPSATATPTPSHSPHRRRAPTPVATPEPPRKAFAYNLFRRGDYVAQYTLEWCVGASLQMALNMTTDTNDTSRRRQQALWTMAQARSVSPFGGANPIGWTAALNDLGIGPYELVSVPDLETHPAGRGDRASRDEAAGRPGHVARTSCVGDERLRIGRRPAAPRLDHGHRRPRPRPALSATAAAAGARRRSRTPC